MIKSLLRTLLPVVFVAFSIGSFAATVDTVTTYSTAMKKQIKAVVIAPDNYATAKELPVVYLLHG